MSLIKWNQPSPLASRRNWIENFFTGTDDFFNKWDWEKGNNFPAINIKEDKDAFLIEVAAPGMKKEDFTVELENGVLMISASAEEKKEENMANLRRQEFSYRNFKRSMWMPDNVAGDKISASYEFGLLKLTLPKAPALATAKSNKIQVV